MLGSELVFVNLQISTEDLKKRLGQRHMGNEEAVEMLAVSCKTVIIMLWITFFIFIDIH